MPRVYGRVLRLSAATVILALLVGGMLLGETLTLLALPFAALALGLACFLRLAQPALE